MISKPKTKEQLIYFLVSTIKLGTYDKRFLSNLETMNLVNKKPLTTNQASLLDKITSRYKKQIEKLEIHVDELLNLPWDNTPIPSLPQFTEVHLLLVDDELILRSPYKKDFVTEFRNLEINPIWHKEDRFWRMPANSYTLKVIKNSIEKHYTKINYCDSIKSMLDSTSIYDAKIWNPAFCHINNNFYVVATSPMLQQAIEHLSFDIDLALLPRLKRFGINIDQSVIDEYLKKFSQEEIDFAINDVVEFNYSDENLVDYLLQIKPDLIVINDSFKLGHLRKAKTLLENKITCIIRNKDEQILSDLHEYEFPVLLTGKVFTATYALKYACGTSKVIHIVNNDPVIIL